MGKQFRALNTIFIFCLLISSSFGAGVSRKKAKLSKHPVVIIISYDGFRYDYMSKTATPNLNRVKRSGVSVPHMDNQFLTFTFPNHHSIATGLFIESHGVVANVVYDPLYEKELRGYSNDPGFWNYSTGVLPLYTVNELAGDGRASGVMMWPGSEEVWGDKDTKASYIEVYNENVPYETRVDTVISWITNETNPANLVFLYCDEPDSTGHKFGPEGPEIIKVITRMDQVTGYLLKRFEDLGILDKVNLMFLSDHGMQEIQPKAIIPFKDIVNASLYENHGKSPVLQILPNEPGQTQEIYEEFKAAAEKTDSHFDVYLKEELQELKPHWHYSNSRRIMPILLLAHLEWAFQDDWNNKDVVTGAHGFDSTNPSMWPYFMARGPLFKVNAMEKVFSNVDLFPLVCHIMGIKPPPNNGSLTKTLPLLRSSAVWHGSSVHCYSGLVVLVVFGCLFPLHI